MFYLWLGMAVAFFILAVISAKLEANSRREHWADRCLLAEARDALIESTPVWRSCADDVPSTTRNVIVDDEFELLMMRWDASKWRPLDASLEEEYDTGLCLGAMWCELPEREAAQ